MGYHAQLSPSSAFRWVSCTASIGAQAGKPNKTSPASRHGTCGHQLSAECLSSGVEPDEYLGRVMIFPEGRHVNEDWRENLELDIELGLPVEAEEVVTEQLVEACRLYINFVRTMAQALGGTPIVEQRVPIGHITGEDGATGTSDVVMPAGEVLVTIDAKFGRAKVYAYDVIEPADYDVITGEVTPPVLRMNLQLALYLLGSLEKYRHLGNFKRVKAVIVQPYLAHVSEYECSVEELEELGRWIASRANETRTNPVFEPSNKNCFFCLAKGDCYARTKYTLEQCVEGFDDVETAQPKPIFLPRLGELYSLLPMIRNWCDDIEKRCHDEVAGGFPVIGVDNEPMKLVEGKKGNKAWVNEAQVLGYFKKNIRMSDEQCYKRRLISPTEAAELAPKKSRKKGQPAPESVIGITQWNRLQELIHQPQGKPQLALGSDPRPPYAKADANDMEDVPPADDLGDLL